MRKNLLFNILGVFAIVFALSSCDEDELVAPISSDDYPTATFTTDFTGSEVREGETIKYTITLDKPIEQKLRFSLKTSGTFDEDDVAFPEQVVIPAYSTQAEFNIEFLSDYLPEEDKTFSFELGEFNLLSCYFLNPATVNPKMDLTLVNVNDADALTVSFDWSSDDDIDIVTWSGADPMEEWGEDGVSGAQPETDMAIWLTDPVGTYYVNIMHWGAPAFDYTFTLGHPDGTVQVIEGTFDSDNLDQYTNDIWTTWKDGPADSYRVLKVENTGTSFTVTKL